jgi:hypothetical protein
MCHFFVVFFAFAAGFLAAGFFVGFLAGIISPL